MKKQLCVSYGITVCNELEEVKRLVNFLLSNKRQQDEIVILFDEKSGTDEVFDYIESQVHDCEVFCEKFEGHFADWKNQLTSYCTGDYIIQLDADELPSEDLIKGLPYILEQNPELDVLLVPRINTVSGITKGHVDQWGWRLSKMESPNLIEEKEIDTESEEYRLLEEGGFIIEEHSVSI